MNQVTSSVRHWQWPNHNISNQSQLLELLCVNHIGKFKDGRHSNCWHIITFKLIDVGTHLIPLFDGFRLCRIHLWWFGVDLGISKSTNKYIYIIICLFSYSQINWDVKSFMKVVTELGWSFSGDRPWACCSWYMWCYGKCSSYVSKITKIGKTHHF